MKFYNFFIIFILIICWGKQLFAFPQQIDELITEAKRLKKTNPDSALLVLDIAIPKANEAGDKTNEALAISIQGSVYKIQGKFNLADNQYHKALAIREAIGDSIGIAKTYNNLSSLERRQSNYGKAIEYSHQAIRIIEGKNEQKLLANMYINLANILHDKKDYTEAIETYQKVISTLNILDNKERIAMAKENMAVVYADMGQYNEAIKNYTEAEKIFEQYNDIYEISKLNNNLGVCYWKNKKKDEAIQCFKKSCKQAKEVNAAFVLGEASINLCGIYTELKNSSEAKKYLNQADSIFQYDLGGLRDRLDLATTYAKYFELKNLDSKAIEYYKKAYALNDSIHSKKREELLAVEEAKLGMEQEKVKSREMYLKYLATLFVLVLLSFIILGGFLTYQRKQKEYEATINDALSSAKLKGEKLGRKRISSELHDSISTSLVAVKRDLELALLKFGKGKDIIPGLHKTIVLADKAYNRVRDLSHQLEPSALEWLDDIDIHIRLLEDNDKFKVEKSIDIDKKIPLKLGGEISKIIGVLLHNVEEHSKASEVFIELTSFDQGINLMIVDNGVGFDDKKINSNGLGVKSVKRRVEALKGKYDIDTRLGTTITIDIPLNHSNGKFEKTFIFGEND